MLRDYVHLWKEIHPSKNTHLDVNKLKAKSNKKIWWKCEKKGHEWESSVCNREKGTTCPYCSNVKVCDDTSVARLFPDIAKEWHPTKNAFTANTIFPGSNKKVWWQCSKNTEHIWETTPNSRCLKHTNCPHCHGKTIFGGNTLQEKYTDLCKEIHPTKNENFNPLSICPKSDKKLWWKCENGHEYETKISNRTINNTGCPFCTGKKPSDENNLKVCFPELVKEWHPIKNKKQPEEYTKSSGISVWWQCSKNNTHEWEASIVNRSEKANGCPFCSGRKADDLWNLENKYPEIAKEWNIQKNGNINPKEITPGCSLKFWWKCLKNPLHEWEAKVCNRTGNNTGCPYCKMSHMEKKVEAYCIKKNIKFEAQKKFYGLGQLSYDFYFPDYNILIECDGIQHFEESDDFFHHQKTLLNQKKRDIRKNIFALKKNIPLLRICYLNERYIDKLIDCFLERIKREKVTIVFSSPFMYRTPNKK